LFAAEGIAPLAPADSNARPTRLGNRRKKAGVGGERPGPFVFDTRTRVVNIGALGKSLLVGRVV
jgi:hypothetical protein